VNLNFLEPSGPVQACNGTALPFPTTISQETSKYAQGKLKGRNYNIEKYFNTFMTVYILTYIILCITFILFWA